MENPFAVPPPLFTAKKRKVTGDVSLRGFFSEAEYRMHSVDGDVHESSLYVEEERRHDASKAKKAGTGKRVSTEDRSTAATSLANLAPATVAMAKPPKHLSLVVLDRIKKSQPILTAQAANIANRLSSLSVTEHVEYMRLENKRITAHQGGIPLILALTSKENADLARLRMRVKAEQAEFCHQLEMLAKKDALIDYTYVPEYAAKWHDAMLQSCRNLVLHSYPRFFEMLVTLPLRLRASPTTQPDVNVMTHLQGVFTTGPYRVIDSACLAPDITIDPSVHSSVQVDECLKCMATWDAISADGEAEKLMGQFDCDIAISSSTLLALFNAIGSEQDFHKVDLLIPVKSRVCVVGGKSKRQIYFDRPLPRSRPSAREKISQASRAAAIAVLAVAVRELNPPSTIWLNEWLPILMSMLDDIHLQQDGTGAIGSSARGRTTYNVWSLKGTKMLVRTTHHAFIRDRSDPKRKTSASIHVKPDMKHLGLEEQISRNERASAWLHSWIRGDSTVLLGRLDPQTSRVAAWMKYSTQAMAISADEPGVIDLIDPIELSEVLDRVISALQSTSVGNYLIRSNGGRNPDQHVLEIYRSVSEGDMESCFDLFKHVNDAGSTSTDSLDYVPPKYHHLLHRAPYTFRTGTYCRDYLLDSECPRVVDGEKCDRLHLFFREIKVGSTWSFEDHTSLLKKTKNSQARIKALSIIPDFAFCPGSKSVRRVSLLSDLYANVMCEKPTECQLPHLSLHEVAERVADSRLRTVRLKRNKSKSTNKSKRH